MILGSGPGAVVARDWATPPGRALVAINNAWRLRPDWTHHIHPEDFLGDRRPERLVPGQRQVQYDEYVPSQNAFGGVVYAGGTMAFTAGYWALHRLKPHCLAFIGCDMVYPKQGATHFYGTGTADPLREDLTLRSLEAKAARLFLLAARAGCACVNLSPDESRLVFPRRSPETLDSCKPLAGLPLDAIAAIEQLETETGYFVASGRYWEEQERFDPNRIDAIDRAWLEAFALLEEGGSVRA